MQLRTALRAPASNAYNGPSSRRSGKRRVSRLWTASPGERAATLSMGGRAQRVPREHTADAVANQHYERLRVMRPGVPSYQRVG